ncbi:helix-turn-helix domain-containing protein [Nonomuraea sp. NPDC049152]|uniref:helix-turn-helix domain-containing protein n=1 Tax=Nonomuraea sp. NPDC049152 TaxID=3154350 RepID=UPI0033F21D7D
MRPRWRHIQAFVEHNLADAELTPRAVAERHHISVRYLQLLFQRQGTTLTEHCRTDLADPPLRQLPIRAIAARWRFTRAADFTRSFRAAYAMPPSDYRHSALGTPAPGAYKDCAEC